MQTETQISDIALRIRRAFRRATARDPNEKRDGAVGQALRRVTHCLQRRFSRCQCLVTTGGHTPPAANDIPTLAATIQVARAILNLHEVITRS